MHSKTLKSLIKARSPSPKALLYKKEITLYFTDLTTLGGPLTLAVCHSETYCVNLCDCLNCGSAATMKLSSSQLEVRRQLID